MVSPLPLWVSQQMLSALNTRISLHHAERIPRHQPYVIVSNHRSFMDPMLLMVALDQTIRFACHRYMKQIPLLKELVGPMGGFALESPTGQSHGRYRGLFDHASRFLLDGDTVGIFPEGAQPMVHQTRPNSLGVFHRGFAHLLLRSPARKVTVLPVAIASCEESNHSAFPVRLLHWFDPSEPLFDHNGWHPLVIYQTVNVMIGNPISVSMNDRASYHGRHGRLLSQRLTQQCHNQVQALLQQGLTFA